MSIKLFFGECILNNIFTYFHSLLMRLHMCIHAGLHTLTQARLPRASLRKQTHTHTHTHTHTNPKLLVYRNSKGKFRGLFDFTLFIYFVQIKMPRQNKKPV